MNGFLNILKPPGMTSAAVVGRVRRLTGERRVGHAGTLDPEAAGILPIMLGRATRLFDYLVDKEKSYITEVGFGMATDTMDAAGRVTETGDAYPDLDLVREKVHALEGDIRQRPSMYSAIKMGGKPLYELARRGETVEVPERVVHVERILVLEERPEHGVLMQVDCGRGTYIRSICEDLGRLCNCPAYMRFLLRTRSGAFGIDTAVTLEEAEQLAGEGRLAGKVLPLDMPLQHIPRLDVRPGSEKAALNGVALKKEQVDGGMTGEVFRVCLKDRFLGICRLENGLLAWKVLFPGEREE